MTLHAVIVMAVGFGLIAATLTFAYHATRFLAWLEARGQAFDGDLAAQRDKGGAVIRPLVPPGPYTAELLARAQSRHLTEEWARLDEESSP